MNTKSPSKFQHKRLSTDQWQDIMSAYDQSGLTQEAYCARESLAPSTFYAWRHRLSGTKRIKRPVPVPEPGFIELTPPQPQISTDWDIELSLGENIVLRLRRSR